MWMTGLTSVSALFVVGVLAGNLQLADAKNWRYWSNVGCYEFSFERTVFFELTDAATPLSCDGCEGSELSAIVNTSLIPSPTTPDQIQHFIAGSIRNSDSNTPEECITSCNSTGYEYAAMQDGNTCICTNEQPLAQTSAANCNTACSGNASFSCGGSWVMDVHQNPAYHSSGLTYIGCFKNTFNDLDRMLFEGTYNNFQNNTPEWCVTYCTAGGFDYAGLQYSSQCICSNSGPQGNSDESECTYGCAGDSSINMCGGLGYINIFHTEAHKSTIDDYGCGITAQDTYYQRWYEDMGHCNITLGANSAGGGSGNSEPTEKYHIMVMAEGTTPPTFLSVSPNDHPLPSCLTETKQQVNMGGGRYRAALFPSSDGRQPIACGGGGGSQSKRCIRYNGTTDSWTYESNTQYGASNGQFYDSRPDGRLIVAGGQDSRKVDWSTDYGQTKISLPDIPSDYAKGGALQFGCVVIVNATTVLFAGGEHKDNSAIYTYYLNVDTKTWTRGTDMSIGRKGLSCNLITEPYLGVVIIGGEHSGVMFDRVDILNLETNEISTGQSSPINLSRHASVSNANKIVVIGGKGSSSSGFMDTYQYDSNKAGSGQEWTKLDGKVAAQGSAYGVMNAGAMFIDDMDICN